ncbi:hypothetical protein M427DRAFT_45821 [Gonapodya prolifera JEL478]|uniref:Protein kinase domain-containing protein n=1 Tax=Gonapodya prolifera (strain JEL478) TaxID=1344416 RepID=A0A139A981_GONPJ|nr:hypothetical protein M427DRAFT_45821 [Gonapodya prolifera JEL478]|eukprot:KXS13244.1 hypothetical protein M427DRAFT_45821 [Gonapodya prolifera JEL478]
MERGNVKEYVSTVKGKEGFHNKVFGLLYDIARGIVHLHNVAGVIHTDLKPGNVLLWTAKFLPYRKLDKDEIDAVLGKILRSERPKVLDVNMPDKVLSLMHPCWMKERGSWPKFADIPCENSAFINLDPQTPFAEGQRLQHLGELSDAIQMYKIAGELNHMEAQLRFAEWCKVGLGLYS